MTLYNKKCKGCGGILSDDQTSPSYVPKFDQEKTIYCYRCFRLKHYNEVNYTEESAATIKNVIEKLDFSYAMVFLIVDVLDLEHTIFKLPANAKNICVIVNKMDLLPNDINYENICENIRLNIESKKIGHTNIIFSSINSKSSLSRIEDQIYATRKQKHYFIGKSNVGKSSLINALLSKHHLDPKLTCSALINTTINLQKINFPKYEIIDTPGFLTDENILNFIDRKDQKNIFNNQEVKPFIFQVKVPRTLCIENLIQINIQPTENKIASVICYMNNLLNVTTCKFNSENKLIYDNRINYKIDNIQWKNNKFDLNEEKTSLCISGLGMIVFKNVKTCEIRYLDKLGINFLKITIA